MENIATLIDPPGSTLSESTWITAILSAADCDLLLDLHNVYANGLNHGYDPKAFLQELLWKWLPAALPISADQILLKTTLRNASVERVESSLFSGIGFVPTSKAAIRKRRKMEFLRHCTR